MSNTVKQHVIPQCYIKNFLNKDGLVEVLNLEVSKIKNAIYCQTYPPSAIGYIEHFYDIELDTLASISGIKSKLAAELALKLHTEDDFNKIWKNFKTLPYDFTSDLKKKVANILFSILLRSQVTRDHFESLDFANTEILTKEDIKDHNLNIDIVEKINKIFNESAQNSGNKQILNIYIQNFLESNAVAAYTDLINGYWILHYANDCRFITTDTPIVSEYKNESGKYVWQTTILKDNCSVFAVIDSRTLLEIKISKEDIPNCYREHINETIKEVDFVEKINDNMMRLAKKWCFSSDRKYLIDSYYKNNQLNTLL